MAQVKGDTRKRWPVKHPLSLYKEDVKDLARRNNLKIIDVKFEKSIKSEIIVAKPPKLTLVNPTEEAK